MRQYALVVALALVLAGCNAPVGPGGTPSAGSADTAAPAGTQSPTPSGTPAPDPGDVGLAADGVVDAQALADAHHEYLGEHSYTYTRTVTVRGPNDTVLLDTRQRAEVDVGRDNFTWNRSSRVDDAAPRWLVDLYGGSRSERAYSNESMTIVVVDVGSGPHVTRYQERGGFETPFLGARRSLTDAEDIQRTFESIDTEVVGVDRTGGVVSYRLAGTDGPHDYTIGRWPELPIAVTSLRATVDRTGLVRKLVLRYEIRRDGDRYRVRHVMSFEGVGATTVERPAWVDGL
jgi:hypothetical protein